MAKKNTVLCGNCRRPLKKSWLGCPHCMRPNGGYRPPAAKAARTTMGKIGSARCPVGHLTRAGANYCTTCGQPMGSFKSAWRQTPDDVRREQLMRKLTDPDPMARNVAHYDLHPELKPPWSDQ